MGKGACAVDGDREYLGFSSDRSGLSRLHVRESVARRGRRFTRELTIAVSESELCPARLTVVQDEEAA